MRKRVGVVVVCVVGVVGVLVTLLAVRSESRPMASFAYLGTVTNVVGRFGRFSVSNCCEAPIHYIPNLVQFSSNGVVYSVQSPGSPNMDLHPHQVETFQLAWPAGVRRWHGMVNVGREKKGLESLPLRIKWTVHYGFSYAFKNGILSPTGKIHDGRLMATPEVGE